METKKLEALVDELKTVLPFKATTTSGDIVLIVGRNPRMLIYALVTSIERDATKREEWWHLGLTFLTVPPQQVIWTLRTDQMTGKEIFTMGGEERFFQAVDIVGKDQGQDGPGADKAPPRGTLKRIK